jgi:ABC-type transport system involved in cytochrome bd biosynthesis, ATPase and permease components
LARAFLRPAPILLLDEPFAGLDPDAERLILAALERRKSTQTILMIEHRPTAIRAADHLVLLEAGEVKASGRFSNLTAEGDLLAPWFQAPPDH